MGLGRAAMTKSLLLATAGAALLSLGCHGLHDVAREPAALHGGATPGAAVIVLGEDGRPAAHGRADGAGDFTLTALPAGVAQVVVNDLDGHGAVREVTLLGGTTADLGRLTLQPLEGIAGVFDLGGIGFEERVSRDAGDHLEPRYTSDAARVYTLRRLPHDETVAIVETDTTTGVTRVLREGETRAGFATFGEDSTPALFGDRTYVAMLVRPPEASGFSPETWLALDVASGAELPLSVQSGTGYVRQSTDQTPEVWGVPYYLAAPDTPRLAYVAKVGGTVPSLGDPDAPNAPVIELCALALPAGGRRCVRLPGTGVGRLTWAGATAFVVMEAGQPPSTYRSAYQVDFAGDGILRDFDSLGYSVDDLVARPAGIVAGLSHAAYGAILAKGDPAGGNLEQVMTLPPGQGFRRVAASPDLGRALVAIGAAGQVQGYTHLVDLTRPDTAVALPTSVILDGESFAVRSQCRVKEWWHEAVRGDEDLYEACFAPDGAVLAQLQTTDAQCLALIGETCPVGGLVASLDATTFAATAVGRGPALAAPGHPGRVAQIQRDAETGYRQILLLDDGAAPRPISFVSADHGDCAWTPDGAVLRYFTRDPERGYVGLFRIDVEALVALGGGP